MRGMCLSWKVIASLSAVALGTVVLAPQLALAALPILVVAACPLSCLLMMRRMRTRSNCRTSADSIPGRSLDGAVNQEDRIAQLEAEIQRLRVNRVGKSAELQPSGPTNVQRPVA